MSRYHSYLNTAVKIIDSFKGEIPFSIFIKQFFAGEKKYGSNDRRQIIGLCYNYYRLGFAAAQTSTEERIVLAYFLCNNQPSPFMAQVNAVWNNQIIQPLNEKLKLLNNSFSVENIFPFKNELGEFIDAGALGRSFLVQPSLYLRVRPGQRNMVMDKLAMNGVEYLVGDDCFELAPATRIETFLELDKEVVVQDYNSQKVLNYFKEIKYPGALSVWDCCAASGGKSILAWDLFNSNIELTVSDIRESILANLHARFKRAGIKKYKSFVADIANENLQYKASIYDIIICDAPCTGSGTWGRTPEQLCFFSAGQVDFFSERQKRIVDGVIPHLKNGGMFFYITCSVFKKENEVIAEYIQKQKNLELLYMQLLEGYNKKADSMFVAVFRK
ncbi:MAG: methyltransferase domain-containing protein [Ferruginibacter sp.]